MKPLIRHKSLLLLFALLWLLPMHGFSQHSKSKADSLRAALKQTNTDTVVLSIYHNLYALTDSLVYAHMEYELANDISDTKWIAQANLDIGRFYYFYSNNQDTAFAYLKRAMQLGEANNYLPLLASVYRYMGFLYRATDSYTAKSYYEKSLIICQKLHNDLLASYDYSAVGNIYESMRTNLSDKTALAYYQKSLDIRQKIGSYEEKASSLLETSRVYELLGDFYKAFYLRQQGLALAQDAKDNANIISLTHVIACDYTDLFHDYPKSLEFQLKAYDLAKKDKPDFEMLSEITRAAAKTYALMGNCRQSGDYYLISLQYIDSLNAHRNNEVFNMSNAKHNLQVEVEKQKAMVTDAQLSEQRTQTEKANILRNALLAGFALLLVIAGLLYAGYRRKNMSNHRLAVSNRQLEEANVTIESKNHDITDSINYASTIQKTILMPKEKMAQKLREIFVVNIPKDIVSGDFYYYADLDEKVVIGACDCTGHGVPGAIVSIFCSNALHRAVKRFHIEETGKILDKVRELVLETFGNAGTEVRDGMDISLCEIDLNTREVLWSGAHNALLYTHNGAMSELTADKQPIGICDNPKPFTTHKLKLDKGDCIYLLTDGYADQFGGPKGKKFSKQQVRDVLLSIHNKTMDEQGSLLLNAHKDWKGINPQVDDILVIGIKL